MTDSRVLVRGSVTDAALVPLWAEQLALEFRLSRPGTGAAASVADGALYSTAPVKVSPDANGEFVVRLTPNDLIQGDTFYQVRATWLGSSGSPESLDLYRIFVPMTGGWITELVDKSWQVAQVIYSPTQPREWPLGAVWINSVTGDMLRNQSSKLAYLGNVTGPRGPEGKPGEQGAPGVNAVPAQSAVATYLSTASSPVHAAVQDILRADRERFDLGSARLEFGARAQRPASEVRVMQSVDVVSALGGEIWYSQIGAGSTGARESTVIVRCTPDGSYVGEMTLLDAGHGTSVFIEVDEFGQIWVWSSFINEAIASGAGRYNVVRVPWAQGATRAWSYASAYKVALISGGDYTSVHYDDVNDEVGVRKNITDTKFQFSRYRRADLVAGVNAPMDVFEHTWGSDYFGQGFALLDGQWYVLSGSSETNSPVYPAQVWRLDPATSTVTLKRSVELARRSPGGGVLAGFSEPEGLAVGRGPQGEPSLVFGMSTGPTGGRAYTFWTLHMGATPYVNQAMAQDALWGDSGWASTAITGWPSNATPRASGSEAFGARIAGGYLEMRGMVDGAFTSTGGAITLGYLRPGYYSAARFLRGLVVKQMTAANPIPDARVEIGTDGRVQVLLSALDTGTVAWLDFTGFRVPLS